MVHPIVLFFIVSFVCVSCVICYNHVLSVIYDTLAVFVLYGIGSG